MGFDAAGAAAAGRGADERVLPARPRRSSGRSPGRAAIVRPADRDRRRPGRSPSIWRSAPTACAFARPGAGDRPAGRLARGVRGRRSTQGEPRLRRGAACHSGRTSAGTPRSTSWRRAEARSRIRSMLRPRPGLSARLSDMLDCGLLGAIFPEFEKIHCRVIRDFYHKYTVDEHTLLTIRDARVAVASGEREPRAFRLDPQRSPRARAPDARPALPRRRQVARRRARPPRASRLAGPMLARLRLPEHDRQAVEFLIAHHLAMSQRGVPPRLRRPRHGRRSSPRSSATKSF